MFHVKHLSPALAQQFKDFGFDPLGIDRLKRYEALLRQWQKAINLISPTTLDDIWSRHLLDSAQLWPLIQQLNLETRIIDLGSGGGLPGLILAIAGAKHVTMVESDIRKGIFLRETARELGLEQVTVLTQRIEKVTVLTAPIITARALAPLKQLLAWAEPLQEPGGAYLFLKGQDWQMELQQVPDKYVIKTTPSLTDSKACIVTLRECFT